jgi:uncharacterized membrane protein
MLWIGVLLLIAPYVTLFAIYGNKEITGIDAKIWPFYMLSSVSGLIIIALSVIKKAKHVAIPSQKRKLGFVLMAIAGLYLVPSIIGTAVTSTHEPLRIMLLGLLANILINLLNPIFLLFLFGGMYLIKPQVVTLTKERYRTYYWIYLLAMTGWFFSYAIKSWTNHEFDQFGSPWFSAGILAVLLLIIVVLKFIKKQSWSQALNYLGGVEPRDEREIAILERASRTTVNVSVLAAIISVAIIVTVPAPSTNGLYMSIMAYAFFILGIRNFFAWRMGLR